MSKIQMLKFIDRLIGKCAVSFMSTILNATGPGSQRTFLLIRPGGIGDAVLLMPALRSLKNAFPNAEIDILAEKRNRQVFTFNRHVRSVYAYDNPVNLLKVLGIKYDVVIDTEQFHRLSVVVAKLTGTPMLVGYATNERSRLLSHPVAYSHQNYEMDSFFNLLQPLGIAKPRTIPAPFLEIPEKAALRAAELLDGFCHKAFIAVFPGASIPERRWGVDKFMAVARALKGRGVSVIIIGGRDCLFDGSKIISVADGLNLAGKTNLIETAAVIEKAALLISADSGILHIAAGVGTRTISLFGPGIENKWAPRGEAHIVLNKRLSCSPCTRFGYTPKCPNGVKCMRDISVENVLDAVDCVMKIPGQ
jgi:ADP-heptose:LPS heptosyltransferase